MCCFHNTCLFGGGGILTPKPGNENSKAYESETETETWLDHCDSDFDGGIGSEWSPYLISTPEQLAYLAAEPARTDCYYLQTADLYMDQYEWVPIGREGGLPFMGTYDGGGYSIYGLRMNVNIDKVQGGVSVYLGLFGYVGAGTQPATIKNVNIKQSTFNCETIDGVQGGFNYIFIGSVVAYAETLENDCCSAIENCFSDAKITVYVYMDWGSLSGCLVGGVIGDNCASIKNCRYNGDISVTLENFSAGSEEFWVCCGGITSGYWSQDGSPLEDCRTDAYIYVDTRYFEGESVFVGGIVGSCSSDREINRCTVAGRIEVYTSDQSATSVGGITGDAAASIDLCSVNASLRLMGNARSDAYYYGWGVGFRSIGSAASIRHSYFVGSMYSDNYGHSDTGYDFDRDLYADYGLYGQDGCYAIINGRRTTYGGDYSGWSIVPNFNNGFPIQNDLYAIGVGEFTSEDIIDYLLGELGFEWMAP